MSEEICFIDGWVQEDAFQGWLVKVSNDEKRAYCRVCAIVLRAHRGDLLSHSRTPNHLSSVKAAQDAGFSSGPISVQIVCNEEEEDFSQVQQEEDVRDGDDPDYKENNTSSRRYGGRSSNSNGGTKYVKKYRTQWEDHEEFKDWLQPYPDDVRRAYCKACKAILRAHRHDLSCHARTSRHQKRMEEFKPEEYSSADNPDPLKPEDTEEIEIDGAIAIFPDPDPEPEGLEAPKPKIIKMSKASLIKKEVVGSGGKPASKKKPKFNASEVLAAIDGNEFTGYELLQIVKKCVLKL